MTHGAVGPYLLFPQILEDLDLLRSLEAEASQDPNVLTGTPCSPGEVEGVVRVVTSVEQTSVSCRGGCVVEGVVRVATSIEQTSVSCRGG
jgi:hypothetical protein